ncbi:unnamed protein product [Spirodela intermedia]|uniref:Uncharacterized protein n=1 Tax=Spirodela intermedia TaxID=51605 RepID=A0A7I8J2X8_SPIIN|nr:unnamed protein product [Spirodela intermedia]CAA6664597.1 unnamed protein product [Spirodela intermedia]
MDISDKLWDDTVAGPAPEAGLGRLRRNPTFSSPMRPAIQQREDSPATPPPSYDVDAAAAIRVTRSITIVRTASRGSTESGLSSRSLPSTRNRLPLPLDANAEGGDRKHRWRKSSGTAPPEPLESLEVVISSLDR